MDKAKKVLMLLETGFPPDERVEKEIISLQEQGMLVHLACSTRKKEAGYEEIRGIPVHRLKLGKIWFKLSALILIFPFYLRKWMSFAETLHKKFDFDIVHVHDLPLSRAGKKLKDKYGLKLVCDQHEYYSNWIVDTAHYNTITGRMVKRLSNWKTYEAEMLSYADLVVTVAEPLRKQYLEDYNLDPKKTITLPNTPSKRIFSPEKIDSSLFPQYKKHFSVLYFGGLDILRGIDNIIQAIPEIIKEVPSFKFVLAGRKYGGYDPVQTALKTGVEQYVDFIGWVALEEIPSLISNCTLGIFTPPSKRTEINKTIATKNYQFLVMGTPIVVGNAELMKSFTEELGIGISVDEGNPGSIARGIIKLAKESSLRKSISENCSKIAREYVWENTVKSLISAYNNI